MSSAQVNCPSCGAAIEFKVGSSMVTVCAYCRSVVARGDRKLEDLGKVAELVDTGAILEVWLKGRYQGVPFHLTGRAQLGHQKGGVWDEWYAYFADGRWGWLAEAQGKYYITFHNEEANGAPAYQDLPLGEEIEIPGAQASLMMAEKGKAKALSAEGEIPYLLEPGRTFRYADLSGSAGEFATIDYGEEPPAIYVGQEVTLDDLGVAPNQKARRQPKQVEAIGLSCPNCGGALELKAPDKTERVGCPNCGALLDVNQGNLSLFQALESGLVTPLLPLGSVGKFQETEFTVIGFLQRSVTVEGETYYWEEYLLYHPREGFRWLVRSDDHWNEVSSLPPGRVQVHSRIAHYQEQDFKLFQRAVATVECVQGECYWKVQLGEQVQASDYIRPPEILFREVTAPDGDEEAGEINWSLGRYVPAEEVERAFGLQERLARSGKVAPNQPFKYKGIYFPWAIVVTAVVVLGALMVGTSSNRKVYEQTFPVEAFGGGDQGQVFFTTPFELKARQNIRITARAPVENSWVAIDGDLVDEQSGVVQGFGIPLEYYHGVDEGESWTEGGHEASTYVSALPAGTYSLRLDLHGEAHRGPKTLYVRVDQGVPRLLYWFLTLLAVSLIPATIGIYHLIFESRRWQDSNIG